MQTYAQAARWLSRYVGRRRVFGLSAEVAFWLFLSLVPLVAVGGMVAAKVVSGDTSSLSYWLLGVPLPVRELIGRELEHVAAWRSGAVAPVSAAAFVWLGSSGVHSLFDAFGTVTNDSRSWVSNRIAALISCVVLALGGAALAFLAIGAEWAHSLLISRQFFSLFVFTSTPIFRIITGGFLFFAVTVSLYAIGLSANQRRALPLFPGALVATILQAVLVFAYGLVVRATGDGGAYLAGLAAIGVTMTFVYLYVLSILLGLAVSQWLVDKSAADKEPVLQRQNQAR
jgi:membrane protein